MELDMDKIVTDLTEEITMQAVETQKEFIFETIYPYCENVLQMKVDKEELRQILLDGLQKRQTGRWINKFGKEPGYDISGEKTWYIQILCSECGFIKTAIEGHTGQYHYCPNCGAKMETEVKSNG